MLELLRSEGKLSVPALASGMRVTATAVRQRLRRLMRQGLIERETFKAARGRPSHRYLLSEKGRRQGGANFADLTIALWQEVRSISNVEIRSGLLKRIAKSMAQIYGGKLPGETTGQRMQEVSRLMADRNVPFTVEQRRSPDRSSVLPILTAHACPYPDLAEQDRGICAVEKMMLSELVGEKVRLSECRLDGGNCCRFETN